MKRLFALLGFVCLAVSSQAVTRQPYVLPVSFSCQIWGVGNVIVTAYDATGTNPQVLATTSTITESNINTAYFIPGKNYTIQFQASGLSGFGLSFIAPEGYMVFIDGVPRDLYTSGSVPTYQLYTVQILPIASTLRADAGAFSGIDLGKTITWEVALGGLRNGASAGRILFKQPDFLLNPPSSRASLLYSAPANYGQINVVYDGPGYSVLRQIMTPQCMADLLDDGSGGYWIDFYSPTQVTGTGAGNVPYSITAGQSPWRRIHVTAPSSTQLRISEEDGTTSPRIRVSLLTLTSGVVTTGNYVWTLQEGDGTTWLRTTTHTSTVNLDGTRDDVVVVNPPGAGSSVAAKTKYHYFDPAVLVTGSSDTARFNSFSAPLSATTSTTMSFTINITNTGTNTWGSNHYVVMRDSGGTPIGYASVSGLVPTASTTVTMNYTAPASVGTYTYTFQPLDNGVTWLSNTLQVAVNVNNGSTSSGTTDTCNFNSTTFPLLTGPGAVVSFTTAMKNTGTNAWGSNHSVVLRDQWWNAVSSASLNGVAAGGTISPTMTVTAPTTPGIYTYYLSSKNGGTWFTNTHTVILNVVGTGWGEELESITADPDTAQLKTTFVYHITSSAYGNYRRVKSVTSPTGNWTSYLYHDHWGARGQLSTETHPYVNAPSTAQAASLTVGNSTSYNYTADYTGRDRNETSRQTNITNIQSGQRSTTVGLGYTRYGLNYTTYSANDYSGSGAYQTTYSELLDSTGWNADYTSLPLCVKRPDQSQDSYAYHYGTLNGSNLFATAAGTDYVASIVCHGTTNSSGADYLTSVTVYSGSAFTPIYMVPYKSTMELSVRDVRGLVVDTETWVYTGSGNFSLSAHDTYSYDVAGRLLGQVHNSTTMLANTYSKGLLASTTDAGGIATEYTYDSLYRVATQVKKGVSGRAAYITAGYSYATQADITTTNTYDGANHVTQQVVSSGASSLTTTAKFDPAGRKIQQIENVGSANSLTTAYSYSSGGLVSTVTYPGSAYTTTTNNLDGQLASVTGNAAVNQTVTYWIDSGTGRRASQLISGGFTSAWTNTYSDWLGRKTEEWRPEWNGSNYAHQWYYNSSGQLYKTTQPNMAPTLYAYDTLGAKYREGLDVNGNGTLDLASDDRITEYGYSYFLYGTAWGLNKITSIYPRSGVGTPKVISTEWDILQEPSGRLMSAHYFDEFGNETVKIVDAIPGNKEVITTVIRPDSSISDRQVAFNGLGVEARDQAGITMRYEYDALGRKVKDIDPRTGATTTAFIAGTNFVSTVTDPASIVQATYTYNSAGRVQTLTNALSKVSRYEYDTFGRTIHVWGDTETPVEYGFDAMGRQTSMSTYRGGSGWTGSSWPTGTAGTADTTTWTFHAATGLLQTKTDAYPRSVGYTYTIGRQLATRTWSRGTVTTYAYDANTGEQTSISYSDSTPGVTYTYNRLGKSATVVDYTGTRTFTYNLAGTLELQREDMGIIPSGRRITYGYDTGTGVVGRPNGFTLGTSSTPAGEQTVSYGYGSDGRMSSFSANTAGYTNYAFTINYQANSHLVSQIYQGTTGFNDYKLLDANHDWVTNRVVQVGAPLKAEFAYTRDNLGRTTQIAKTGEVFSRYGNGTQGLATTYGYDDKSQVTSEQTKLGGTATVLTGRDDSYAFDPIGNRTSVTHNGNTATYTTNLLNQYTQRTVPGIFDVAGAAGSGTTVTVNGSSTGVTRHGEYFFKGHALTNSPNPVYTSLSISDGTTTTAFPAYLAATPETMTYDNDGNLTVDGRWSYSYDAENRIIWMQATTAAVTAGAPNQGITYRYDYLGRRSLKVTYLYIGGSWVQQTEEHYIYNGWNQIASYNATTLQKSYFWGMDIAGPGQKAGGVGGLLMIQDSSQTYMPVYDAMGNVHGLIKASDGSLAAAYEYDAFGTTLRASGPYASSNPFRYSTKFTDDESSLINYGRRYYSPSQGRFFGRDPMEEKGGIHLYAFCRNNSVNAYDYLGMDDFLMPNEQGYLCVTSGQPTGDDRAAASIAAANKQDWMSYAEGACAGALAAVIAIQNANFDSAMRALNIGVAYNMAGVAASNEAIAAAQASIINGALASILTDTTNVQYAAAVSNTVANGIGTIQSGQIASIAAGISLNYSAAVGIGDFRSTGWTPESNVASPAFVAASEIALMNYDAARDQRRRDSGTPVGNAFAGFTEAANTIDSVAHAAASTYAVVSGFTAVVGAVRGGVAIVRSIAGRQAALPIAPTVTAAGVADTAAGAVRTVSPNALVPVVDSSGNVVRTISYGEIPNGAIIGPRGVVLDAMEVQGGALSDLTSLGKSAAKNP